MKRKIAVSLIIILLAILVYAAVPTVSNVLVNATHRTNTTNDNITVYWTSADSDGDRVLNITDWRIDRVSIARKNIQFEFDARKNATDYTTYNETPIFTKPGWNNITWSPGYGGGRALRLFGKLGRHINYSASSVTNITGNKLTVMAWINLSEINGYNLIAENNYVTSPPVAAGGYALFSTNNEIFFDFETSGTGTNRVQKSGILPGGWMHVAGVYNGTHGIVFINGTQIGTAVAASGNIISAPYPFIIGGRSTIDGNTRFNGSIDDVRVYARALSHQQIREIVRNRTDLILSQETAFGDVWSACITPNDGTNDGAAVCSNNVTIIPPGINHVVSTNITNQSAIVRWNTTALANATLRYGLTTSLGTKSTKSTFYRNRSFTVSSLKNNTFYYFNVTSFDRYGHFETNGTFNFTTLQSEFMPIVTSVNITSTSGKDDIDDNLTATWASSDGNNDRIANITDWRVNGTSIALLNMPFEHNGTTNASDYSTHKNHATPANGPVWNATGGYNGFAAYYFDGSNDRINLPSISLTNNNTLSMWLHPVASSDGYGTLFAEADGDVGLYYRGTTRTLDFFYSGADHLTTTALTEGTWTHVALTSNAGAVSFYINGVKDASTYSSAVKYVAERIGDDIFSDNYKGFIDEVKVFNRSLSAEQIAQLYRNRTDLIVSNETILGDIWSVAVTSNDGNSNGAAEISDNTTIIDFVAPTPLSDNGGGGAETISPPSVVIPTLPKPALPAIETPKPAGTTSISDSQLSKSTIACSENATVGNVTEAIDYSSQILQNYELLVNPFRLDCKSPSARLTFSVPDSYANITAFKCINGKCAPVGMEARTELKCGAKIFEDIARKTNLLTPEMFPIEVIHSEINKGETNLASGNIVAAFSEGTKGKVTLDKMLSSVPEAKNTRIRIVGTPVELAFEVQQTGQASITLPYTVPEHVDELSTAIYILNKSSSTWAYVGGDVRKNQKTVSVSVPNIEKYSENNKIIMAPMALLCLNCFDVKLEKIYDGGSRDAVVLVHGFENTPERFEDIINDIRLTKQPWQVWTFGYPSSLPVEDTAKEFADLLQLNARDSDFVYIAAHSMGGLITQQAIRYAYEQNQGKVNPVYPFVNKVIKAVLIATPNKGALSGDPSAIFNTLLNADTLAGLFNVKSDVITELISGKQIAKVPGVQYLVIAGTQPYEFSKYLGITEKNDGLVSVSSAQTIGGEKISNACYNFWAINSTHTNILNNYDSRKLVERIVATEVSKDIKNKAIMGHSQYFDLEIKSCAMNEQYMIIGTPLRKEAVPDPGLCSCGNGFCGADESDISCPSDCAKLEKPKSSLLDLLLHFKPLRNLTVGLLILIMMIVLLSRKKKSATGLMRFAEYEALDKKHIKQAISKIEESKTKEELTAVDYKAERRLNDMLLQTRICLRTGRLDGAAVYYSNFSSEYSQAPTRLKEKFKEVADRLKEEVKGKMT